MNFLLNKQQKSHKYKPLINRVEFWHNASLAGMQSHPSLFHPKHSTVLMSFLHYHKLIAVFSSRIGTPLFLTFLLSGCAAASVVMPAADFILNATGLKKETPEAPAVPKLPAIALDRELEINVIAGENLNQSEQKQALSVVVKLYRLKDATAFNQLTPDIANSPDKEKTFFGNEASEIREQLLVPKQKHVFKEKIPNDIRYIGLTGLFMRPNVKHWKMILPVEDLDKKNPLVIGVHKCSLSVSSGISKEKNPAPSGELSQIVCP
jgi:type VI secretion system protein VasD